MSHEKNNNTLKVKFNIETMLDNKMRLSDLVDQIECAMIAQACDKFDNNHTHAAIALGINRTTFIMKLRKLRGFGIDPKGDYKQKLKHLF